MLTESLGSSNNSFHDDDMEKSQTTSEPLADLAVSSDSLHSPRSTTLMTLGMSVPDSDDVRVAERVRVVEDVTIVTMQPRDKYH